jgi:glycosyltransferase involved in cell wall biosynthesis
MAPRRRADGAHEGPSSDAASDPEVSVVMPCLNEADTLEACITKAQASLLEHGIRGEVIVADNGSDDDSQGIAKRLGAAVVDVQGRGYGNALMGGIAAARGRFIVMGDADDSYDFRELPAMVAKLREGHDLVQGCRLGSGGGTILPGAMPGLHRRWGNPMFSWLAQKWFRVPVSDIYSGFRGFTRELYERLEQRCTGMEFATEMIIKASLYGASITETPITLHPDRRRAHGPHLRTFRDGWRTLRFFLMYSPRWLFLVPGLSLIAAGFVGFGLAMPGVTLFGATFDAHTLVFASLALLCGYQSLLFGIFTRTFAVTEGLLPADRRLDQLFSVMNLERGLLLSAVALLTGLTLLAAAVVHWAGRDFGALDYSETMRWVVPGATLTAFGFQTVLASFFVSILGLRRLGPGEEPFERADRISPSFEERPRATGRTVA